MNKQPILFASAVLLAQALFGIGAVSAQGIQHFAVLKGGNEVSPGGQAAAGDLDGSGTATVISPAAGQICFSITVQRIGNPTAAHIHRAEAGQNGPIVVNLVAPSTGNPGTSSGCVSGIAAGLVTDIRNRPSQFYVNVHNAAFPLGAVRGQLF
jgi:hypothetical protein